MKHNILKVWEKSSGRRQLEMRRRALLAAEGQLSRRPRNDKHMSPSRKRRFSAAYNKAYNRMSRWNRAKLAAAHVSPTRKPCSAYDNDWVACSERTRDCVYMADTGKCYSAKKSARRTVRHKAVHRTVRRTVHRTVRRTAKRISRNAARKVMPCSQITKSNSCRYREFEAKPPNRNCKYLGNGICRPKN